MFRAFTYRLRPGRAQQEKLTALLEGQRELSNAALEARRGAWRWERRRVTRFEQFGDLAALREVRPEVVAFGVCVCRGTLTRLDEAFAGFFRRVRAGGKAGYPRFKGPGRWDSVAWPDRSGWKLDGPARRLVLHGVGAIPVRFHQPWRGQPRTLTVRRRAGRWEVTVFCAHVPARPLPATGDQVGIDVGVTNLVATSDWELVPNPRPARATAHKLAAAQRDGARRRPGSIRYRQSRAKAARIKAKQARVRKSHLHHVSRCLVDRYDLICHEKLRVASMVRSARGTVDAPGTNVAQKSGLNPGHHRLGVGTAGGHDRLQSGRRWQARHRRQPPPHLAAVRPLRAHRPSQPGQPSRVPVSTLRALRPRRHQRCHQHPSAGQAQHHGAQPTDASCQND
jgi:putative transposase